MPVNNLITLPEYAKGLAKEDIKRTIIEMFAQYSDIMEALPFENLNGSVYVGYRQTVLPNPVFRAINEASSTGHGTLSPFQEASFIVDHDIDVDRAIVDRHGPERRSYEERMGVTAFAQLWVNNFIYGDNTANPRVFNGLAIRSGKYSRTFHNSVAAGGAALSLGQLDAAINNVKEPTHIIAPYASRPLWIQAARTQNLSGFVMQTWEEIGKLKMSYAGLPFLWGYPKDLHPAVLQFNEVGTGGGGAVTASLYVVGLGEGKLRGIQIRPLEAYDVGILQDRIHYRTHLTWDVGLVDEHIYCLARLDSWTNAAILP
jgi:Major capsid protein GP7